MFMAPTYRRDHGCMKRCTDPGLIAKEGLPMRPMRRRNFGMLTVGTAAGLMTTQAQANAQTAAPGGGGTVIRDVVMAVHGGAGSIPRGSLTPDREKGFRDGLEQALRAGFELLRQGRSGLDAVEAAVNVLEDNENFNAGKGAVFNTDAEHELDASIMNGKDLKSGAVAGVHNTKNPISLARMVMERSR